jgi:cob(I)alamin adenosyltransferase
MRITKVYTKTGDKKTTRLVDGSSMPKDCSRVEAYGCVDELNSCIGMSRSLIQSTSGAGDDILGLDACLMRIQNDLFVMGGQFVTPPGAGWDGMVTLVASDVSRLEDELDAMNDVLTPLQEFILPHGSQVVSSLHVARTVCRRGERRVVSLMGEEDVDEQILIYLNRLSDFLFVAARWSTHIKGEEEVYWGRTSL